MKIWLITMLLCPILAWAETRILPETRETDEAGVPEQSAEPEDLENPSITWVDSSHAYATDQVQALTVWMDNFFGDPTYDLEKPDSLVRLEWQNNWDEEDGYKGRVRLRGKLHMPRISKRLNLIFSGKDGDNLGADERKENTDLVGVQYSLGELNRSRVDLTLDAGTWDLRPGIRYRNQGPISKQVGYRYTQRLEYKDGEGVYSTAEVNLDRVLNENSLLRWNNRLIYGEETDGMEWRTQLSLGQRQRPQHGSPARRPEAAVEGTQAEQTEDQVGRGVHQLVPWRIRRYRRLASRGEEDGEHEQDHRAPQSQSPHHARSGQRGKGAIT